MLIAAVPGVLWMKRGARDNSRTGASMGLAILILVATVNTFLPCSMWVQAMPEVFDVPWFYASGVVFTAIAAFHLYTLAKLPPKPRQPGKRKPRSEEHTSELQSLMRISYAVFCLKKKHKNPT